jgi:CelD/BcsL family acetyltransferase involved in cellulose biosynthesis
VLAARDPEGRLVGVLPTLRRRGVVQAPANWHTPCFAPLADGAEPAGALAEALVARGGHRIDLTMLDPGPPGVRELREAAAEAGRALIMRTVARQPYVAIEGDWEGYRKWRLGKGLRKEVGRHRRRLEERGELEVSFDDGGDALGERLDEGFRIEGSGWKRGSAIAARPETDRFYREVASWARGRGWLSLAFLRLDGRPLAFDLRLECAGVVYVLKGGFDREYGRFGPGTLLTHDSIERAFATGASSYELLGQADAYKLRWTDATRERVRVQAFSRSPAGRLSHLAWRWGRPAAKRLLAALGRGGESADAAA